MPRTRARAAARQDPAAEAVAAGWAMVAAHPLFAPLCGRSGSRRVSTALVPADGWAVVDTAGYISINAKRLATDAEWSWVFAHLLLHLGFGHADPGRTGGTNLDAAHSAACDVTVNRFQTTLKIGRSPLLLPADLPNGDEESMAQTWRRSSVPPHLIRCGVGGSGSDIVEHPGRLHGPKTDWEELFAAGLTAAVTAAVDVAGGVRETITAGAEKLAPWERARRWFIASYPLLGSVLAALTVVADAQLARDWDIAVAAVDASSGELYVNPHAQHTAQEWRFVLAHESLHAALAHQSRAGGRDPYLWNLAADFVINQWLVEMGVGEMPDGLLYDPQFAGMSAEGVYDVIAVEARRYRKLATLRGHGSDMLDDQSAHQLGAGAVDLDDLLRRSLATGLSLHTELGRGSLPAGLVAEIRALAHPPITWDVALARWFDEHFPAVQRERSYARPSRRQSASPDIPRAGWRIPEEVVTRRTFGVVLDTSGSMSTVLLGKALGAIASYAAARDVPAARVVFCDAAAYDAGYLDVADIAGRVKVRGRGGTELQPGVHLLERAEDFPADGPILVITDGFIDVLRIRRSHAFLLPVGATLPFAPKGPVFRVS
jgi:predicted metal-dependent peptidase